MDDILKILQRARENEAELCAQLEHIERVRFIIKKMEQRCSDNSEKIYKKLVRLERQLNEQIEVSIEAKRKALALVNVLTGEERCVIESYYILAKNWDEIAGEMYICDRKVYLLRNKAIEHIKKSLRKEAS